MFQCESSAILSSVRQELHQLHNISCQRPIYGVEYIIEEEPPKSPSSALQIQPQSFVFTSEVRLFLHTYFCFHSLF